MSPTSSTSPADTCGIAGHRSPGALAGAPAWTAPPPWMTAEAARMCNFFTGVRFIDYEGLGFAEYIGGNWMAAGEAMSDRGAAPVNPIKGLTLKLHTPGPPRVAQCAEAFPHHCANAVSRGAAARNTMARNIGGLTALSPIPSSGGPSAHGK